MRGSVTSIFSEVSDIAIITDLRKSVVVLIFEGQFMHEVNFKCYAIKLSVFSGICDLLMLGHREAAKVFV